MQTRAQVFYLLALVLVGGCATTFPIKDSRQASEIGKAVCRHDSQFSTSLKWSAVRQDDRWEVTGFEKLGGPMLVVHVPVNGPYPTECFESGYDMLILPSGKSN
jgi:hypothetical protein